MPWDGLGSYLSRFRMFRPPEDAIPSVCAKILSQALEVAVSPDNLSIRSRCLYVRGLDSATRSVVYLKQKSLLELIRDELGEGVIVGIK